MDLTSAARAVAVAATLAGVDAPRAVLAPAPRAVPASQPALVEVARIPVALAQGAREQEYVRKAAGLSEIDAAIAGDGSGEFWIRLRQGGTTFAWPLPELENATRACFAGACYRANLSDSVLTVEPEGGQEGKATFTFDELAAAVFAAAPHAKLSDFVDYAAVYEPGPRPAQSAVFWHKDHTGAIYLAYRMPDELKATTWLVAINGVYFGVRQDGATLVFERKARAGVSGLTSPLSRERRLPGT